MSLILHIAIKLMENWELYEINATKYLNSIIKSPGLEFVKTGGSDSTSNDIVVNFKGKKILSIEAKLSPSQCGQFVLVSDKFNKLTLSDKSKFKNSYTNEILKIIETSHCNNSSILNLNISQDLLSNWVKEYYSKKGVDFIITSKFLDSYNSIIPVSEIDKYFNFYGDLRRKRSGTREVPKRDKGFLIRLLKDYLEKININKYIIFDDRPGLMFEIYENKDIVSSYSYFDNYFISRVNSNLYKVKIRANTNNFNFICRLKYIGVSKNYGEQILKNFISQKIIQLR